MIELNPTNFSLPEYVFNKISHDIITGKYRAGDKLIEAVFQEEYQVSKSPVREAFQMLINAGLIERKNRRGCFVKTFTSREIEDIYLVRIELESMAAKMAYELMTDTQLLRLNELFSFMEQSVEQNDTNAYIRTHNDFQRYFGEVSGNHVLINVCERLRVQNMWYNLQFHNVDIHYDIHTHDDLIKSFNDRVLDSDGIRDLMRNHVAIGLNNFHKFLELQQTDDTRRDSHARNTVSQVNSDKEEY